MQEIIKINKIEPTKTNVGILANELANSVKNGNFPALEFAIKSKFLITALTDALKLINDEVLRELELRNNNTFLLGAKVEVRETGVKYNYEDDTIWSELYAEISPLLEELKKQEEKIKIATKLGATMIDEATGEVLAEVVPKQSTTSYAITLSK